MSSVSFTGDSMFEHFFQDLLAADSDEDTEVCNSAHSNVVFIECCRNTLRRPLFGFLIPMCFIFSALMKGI